MDETVIDYKDKLLKHSSAVETSIANEKLSLENFQKDIINEIALI
jgi:hypothetical protein